MMAAFEEEFLKPRDSSLLDSNDWPILTLQQVEIVDEASGTVCSLLTADAENRLKITGKLSKTKDNVKHLLNRRLSDTLPVNITLNNVPTFSYGQDEEGNVLLWAAGLAGWYEIKPARHYEPIFKGDCEAVNILYFLSDIYREVKGKRAQMARISVDTIFRQYAEDSTNKCSSDAHAEAAVQRHLQFLLKSMREGKEGVKWKHTAIWSYLRNQEDAAIAEEEAYSFQTLDNFHSIDPRSRHAGKGRPSLRPRALKQSQKGAPAGDASPNGGTFDLDRQSSVSIPATRKRKRAALQGKPSHNVTFISLGLSTDSEGEPEVAEAPLPIRDPRSTKILGRKHPSRIVKERVPSLQSNSHGDTWACTVDGCGTKVYAASTPDSKALIEQHFQLHAHDSQLRLDLVLKEQRPYLPVGNLVNKIRELAAKQNAQTAAGDPRARGFEPSFPLPITHSY